MPDWLLKIFSSIVSVKTAAIAIFTCAGLVLFWRIGTKFIEGMTVPSGLASFLLIVIFYSISHILVEVLIHSWRAFNRVILKNKQKREIRESQESFKALCTKTIPLLPESQLKLLELLSESEQAFEVKDDLIHLEKQKYINRIHKISSTNFIYEINKTVKDVLISYLKSERQIMLDDFVKNITEDEKHFISLFFCDAILEGTRESGVMMDFGVFRAGVSLSERHLLKTSKTANYKSFRLLHDTSEHLQKSVFDQSPVRIELNLDPNYIIGSYTSGSGAPSGR